MTQLIDKSALVAEIENRRAEISDACQGYIADKKMAAEYILLNELLDFIDTLEVKEVDSNDTFIEKACAYLDSIGHRYIIDAFRKYMEGE